MAIEKKYKKNILILLSDTGCINFISYEIKYLLLKNNIDIYLIDSDIDKNYKKNLKNLIISKLKFNDNIKKKKYSYILTGTTKNNIYLKKIWLKLNNLGFEIRVFIDAVINIKSRFVNKSNKKKIYIFSRYYVIDLSVKRTLITMGVNPKIIHVIAHSFFIRKNLITNYKKKQCNTIIFLSEPIKEYKETNKIGYNQYKVLDVILNFFENNLSKKINFIIKPHPVENINNYKSYKNKYKNIKVNISNKPIENYYKEVNLCIGMATFALIEFKFNNPNVLSIQSNRKYDPNPFLKKYKINIYQNMKYFLNKSKKIIEEKIILKPIVINNKKIKKLSDYIS